MSWQDVAIIALLGLWAGLGIAAIYFTWKYRRAEKAARDAAVNSIPVQVPQHTLDNDPELACTHVVAGVLDQMLEGQHDAHMRILCHLFGKARAQVAKAEIEMLEKARSVTPAPPKVH